MDALSEAPAVLVQVTGGPDLSVHDTAEAVAALQGRISEDCRLVVGTGQDPTLTGACQITVLGTGLRRHSRTLVAFSEDRSDWRHAAGLPPREPAKQHHFHMTGATAKPRREPEFGSLPPTPAQRKQQADPKKAAKRVAETPVRSSQ